MSRFLLVVLNTLVIFACMNVETDISAFTECEGDGANVRCVVDGDFCRIEMTACIEESCDGEWRFYYRHEEGSWQYILLNFGGICESPCASYTCAIGGLPRGNYEWSIRCTSPDKEWDSGNVYCCIN